MDGQAIDDLAARLGVAKAAFETRWTMRSLQRVDAELYARVVEQIDLLAEAQIVGDEVDAVIQGEAMCRGWVAAVERMEAAGEPDDSYMVGQHGGTLVAIGERAAAHTLVRDGLQAIWLTPNAVAGMVAGLHSLATLRELWPEAEWIRVVEKYPDEPAQEC